MRLLILFIVFTLGSCGPAVQTEKVEPIDYEQLIGHWSIESASRNGKETSTLNDAYLQFSEINELTTNIFGNETKQQLVWQDSIAMVADSSMTYKVLGLNTDTLSFSFEMQRHFFDLLFVKSEPVGTIASDGENL